ncbi:MAG TPA: rhodanese-like domain-containing protein [Nitrospirota bacterium]|nr:rhodanese-like domain-containing protein [Nitrospirota bacterium]
MKRTITPSELNERPSEFTVIDVRRKADYDGNVILDAEWHNPDDVEEWAKSLPTDKEIVLYCARGGSVSNKVLDSLLAVNISARYIEGGIEGWKQSGGKIAGRNRREGDPL